MVAKKKPSAAQLAARAKFVKMVRAKAAAKKKAAPKKVEAKKVAGLDKVTRKGKKTMVHYSRLSGVKKDKSFLDFDELKLIKKERAICIAGYPNKALVVVECIKDFNKAKNSDDLINNPKEFIKIVHSNGYGLLTSHMISNNWEKI